MESNDETREKQRKFSVFLQWKSGAARTRRVCTRRSPKPAPERLREAAFQRGPAIRRRRWPLAFIDTSHACNEVGAQTATPAEAGVAVPRTAGDQCINVADAIRR
ncbi:hypothetical protein [Lysobacter sp. CA199]|uniref:hypothetical protein n=1 Tax=Lysobacter sp. CA199 TaxID=3455608 RepID=UPI003F8D7AE6